MSKEEFEKFKADVISKLETDLDTGANTVYHPEEVKKAIRLAYNKALDDVEEATNDCEINWLISSMIDELKIK